MARNPMEGVELTWEFHGGFETADTVYRLSHGRCVKDREFEVAEWFASLVRLNERIKELKECDYVITGLRKFSGGNNLVIERGSTEATDA